MSARAVSFASTLVAGLLAGASIITMPNATAGAAEECLTTPGGETPAGKHWYYRIERTSKRQCWYLRDIGAKDAGAKDTSAKSAATAAPSAPRSDTTEQNAEAPPQHSIADAHAELRQTQPARSEPSRAPAPPQANPQAAAAPVAPVAAVPPASAAPAPAPNVLENVTRGSLIASRWPDPTGTSPQAAQQQPAAPQPAASDLVADADSDQAPPAAVPVPAPPVAATTPAPAKPTGSLQTLLLVIAGALTLAGLTGSIVFRFGRRRRPAQNSIRGRRVAWDQPRNQPLTAPPAWLDAQRAPRHPEFVPSAPPDDPNERLVRISAFMERMSKQPAN